MSGHKGHLLARGGVLASCHSEERSDEEFPTIEYNPSMQETLRCAQSDRLTEMFVINTISTVS